MESLIYIAREAQARSIKRPTDKGESHITDEGRRQTLRNALSIADQLIQYKHFTVDILTPYVPHLFETAVNYSKGLRMAGIVPTIRVDDSLSIFNSDYAGCIERLINETESARILVTQEENIYAYLTRLRENNPEAPIKVRKGEFLAIKKES